MRDLVRQQRGIPADAQTQAWYGQIDLNGLCAGWAEVHRLHPTWIEDLWAVITSWTPLASVTPDDQLDHRNGI